MLYRVTLKNLIHNNVPQAGIYAPYNNRLNLILKGFKGCTWSQTHKCYYVANNSITCNNLYVYLKKHEVFIDHSQFTVIKSKDQKPAIVYHAHEIAILDSYTNYLTGKRYSTSTIQTYLNLAKPFVKYMQNREIASATSDDVRLYIEQIVKQKNYSISTHRQLVSAIKSLLTLHKNISHLEGLERPKKSDYKPVVLSYIAIIDLLRVTVNLKHRCILALLYSCGLRISELLALELKDIDLERMQLHVRAGKGRKDRYVGIANSMTPLLLNYTSGYKPVKYLFEGSTGLKYSASSVRAFLKRSCKNAKIIKPVTPHTLRHSYATHLIENGTGIAHVQRLLGHAKPETTMLYTHIANVDLVKIENPLDVAVTKRRAVDKNK